MKNDQVKTNQSILKFNRVMVEGFVSNGVETIVYSERPVNKNNCDYKYLKSEDEYDKGIKYHYSRIYNSHVFCILYSIFASFFWIFFHAKRKEDVVILDVLQLALATGTIAACKLKSIPCIGIVTDIPTKSVFQLESNAIKKKDKYNEWLIKKLDGLILLTEQMNDVINPYHKPYLVVEGFADSQINDALIDINKKYDAFTIMYTGGVNQAYGLDILVEGFVKANIPNSQLIIYGGGPYVENLLEFTLKHSNIIYGGIKNNDEIVKEQIKATLLVNPRYTSHDFTKYSFPGKNIEYMVSGTPTLTTNLPGMPSEYKKYVYILDDETVDGMCNALKNISGYSRKRLFDKGLESRAWMLSNKSNVTQCKKIIEFIETYFLEY